MKKEIIEQEDQQKEGSLSTPTSSAGSFPSTTMSVGERLQALVISLRPRQWTKNLAVFIGIVFARRLFSLPSFERAALACVVFCLASSCIYLFNDLLDLENDRRHPTKRWRPLACGKLPVTWAIATIGALILACSGVTLLIFNVRPDQYDLYTKVGGANLLFVLTIVVYLALMALYSIRLKHIVLIDVFIIASGFALRILAGAVVIPVSISPWLYMVTCLLSLFLALSKRRHELTLLQGQAVDHRQILREYSIPLLDQMITIVATATIMAYSLYTFEGNTGDHRLLITVPLVLYGIFRYLYLVYIRMEGGSPEEVLLRDRHILGTVILCTMLIILVLYILPR